MIYKNMDNISQIKALIFSGITLVLLWLIYRGVFYILREYKFYTANGGNYTVDSGYYIYMSKEISTMTSVKIGNMKIYILTLYLISLFFLLFRAIFSLLPLVFE